jgi:hypothetical protein
MATGFKSKKSRERSSNKKVAPKVEKLRELACDAATNEINKCRFEVVASVASMHKAAKDVLDMLAGPKKTGHLQQPAFGQTPDDKKAVNASLKLIEDGVENRDDLKNNLCMLADLCNRRDVLSKPLRGEDLRYAQNLVKSGGVTQADAVMLVYRTLPFMY